MAALIAYTAFTGIINIDTGRTYVQTTLGEYIDLYEKSVLQMLLGKDCWVNYQANKTATHWKNFEDGADYNDNLIPKEYEGVKNMLAYFVYFYYSRDQRSANTPMGDSKGMPINPAINVIKDAQVWNEAVKVWNEAIDYINYVNSITPDTYKYFYPTYLNEINSFGI